MDPSGYMSDLASLLILAPIAIVLFTLYFIGPWLTKQVRKIWPKEAVTWGKVPWKNLTEVPIEDLNSLWNLTLGFIEAVNEVPYVMKHKRGQWGCMATDCQGVEQCPDRPTNWDEWLEVCEHYGVCTLGMRQVGGDGKVTANFPAGSDEHNIISYFESSNFADKYPLMDRAFLTKTGDYAWDQGNAEIYRMNRIIEECIQYFWQEHEVTCEEFENWEPERNFWDDLG
jgi:hypothetical protein